MFNLLSGPQHSPDEVIADALFQPIEYSYTVETLEKLIDDCGLEYLLPCMNQFDKENKREV